MSKMNETAQKRTLAAVSGVLNRLSVISAGLAPTAKRIATFIADHADEVVHMSVTELAERTQSSEGSVIALCQQIGASGYQQLKLALVRELVQPVQFIHEDVARNDTPCVALDKIFHSNMQALRDTLDAIDRAAFTRAVQALSVARRILIYGIGSAAPVAEDAAYRMMRIGLPALIYTDSHAQVVSATLASSHDAVLTISHSGSTIETVTATRLAKEAGATTICISNFGKSPLLSFTDIALHTLARETQFRTEAMTSRIAQLAIVDAMVTALALSTYERASKAIDKSVEALSLKRY